MNILVQFFRYNGHVSRKLMGYITLTSFSVDVSENATPSRPSSPSNRNDDQTVMEWGTLLKKKHVKNHWEAKSLDLDLDWERRFSSLDIGAHVNSIKKKTASSDEDGFLFSSFTQPDKVSYNVTDICQRSEFRVSIFQSCGGGSSQSTVQHRESCQNASQLDCECTFAKMPHS